MRNLASIRQRPSRQQGPILPAEAMSESSNWNLLGFLAEMRSNTGFTSARVPDKLKFLAQVEYSPFTNLPALKKWQWYCWRVDAVNADGSIIEGDLWSFCTGRMIGWWDFERIEGAKFLTPPETTTVGNSSVMRVLSLTAQGAAY